MFLLEIDRRLSGLIWTSMFISSAIVITLTSRSSVLALIGSTIMRLIISIGFQPTLILLSILNVSRTHFSLASTSALSYINRTLIDTLCSQWLYCLPLVNAYAVTARIIIRENI